MNKIIQGDSLKILKTLKSESIDCAITSPPYWALRDYGMEGQLGLESTAEEYVKKLCDIFDEVKRVLKKGGTCFVNIGDTYGGTSDKGDWRDPKYKNGRNGQVRAVNKFAAKKSLCQIPSRFAIEMTNRGWILRNEIIWHKPNSMPSSVKDRFTVDFEKVFFFVKNKKYSFKQQFENSKNKSEMDYRRVLRRNNAEKYKMKKPYQGNFPKSFREDGQRTMRSVWSIATKPFAKAHFATFPEALIEPMIKAGCPQGGVCLDIFMGAGTTALVAKKLNRKYLGIELNSEYIKIANERLNEKI